MEQGDFHAVSMPRGEWTEYALTIPARAGDNLAAVRARAAAWRTRHPRATVVRETVLGSLSALPAGGAWTPDWPVTWVDGASRPGRALAGIQVQAVEGLSPEWVRCGGRVVGAVLEDAQARYGWIGGVTAGDASRPRGEQARQALDALDEGLHEAGLGFGDVVRTWLYLDDVLAWYGEFNRVRTAFFEDCGLAPQRIPASTGIGGRNPAGTAVLGDAVAIRPRGGSPVRIDVVPSPRQCPAPDYGSSFSRAVEIAAPGWRQVLVSGTAAIDATGRTAHTGDLERQMGLTFEVVGSILTSRGLGWGNVTRAAAYCKRGADVEQYEPFRKRLGLPAFPVLVANHAICRDDLLFELEVDAFCASPPSA